LAIRDDDRDAVAQQTPAQRITVGGFVVDEISLLRQRDHGGVHQPFDVLALVFVGARDDGGQRSLAVVHQHENRGAGPLETRGDQVTPFFAGQIVPWAMSWLQSMPSNSSARSTSRDENSLRHSLGQSPTEGRFGRLRTGTRRNRGATAGSIRGFPREEFFDQKPLLVCELGYCVRLGRRVVLYQRRKTTGRQHCLVPPFGSHHYATARPLRSAGVRF